MMDVTGLHAPTVGVPAVGVKVRVGVGVVGSGVGVRLVEVAEGVDVRVLVITGVPEVGVNVLQTVAGTVPVLVGPGVTLVIRLLLVSSLSTTRLVESAVAVRELGVGLRIKSTFTN
jgi:hypothetical protein